MTQTELKNETIFHFDNRKWCKDTITDDLRGGHIQFNPRYKIFGIFLNGVCIYTSKTFGAAEKRLRELFAKWHLEFNESQFND